MEQAISQEKRDLINFRKQMQAMIATSRDAYVKSDGRNPLHRSRTYSSEDIRRIVDSGDPVERA